MRTKVILFVVVLGLADVAGSRNAQAAINVNVTNQGMTAWLFGNDNVPNETLTLVRGQTYNFVVNATGHPFFIASAPGLPVTALSDPGLSASNGTSSGTITFTPSASTQSPIFYQCGVHVAMTGTINLVAAAGVPAVGFWPLTALGLLLAGAGTLAFRRRRLT